ncbi:hypothetical protein KAJ27_08605, partial [bacterium]|nr:hypothetical protein [bacterium]
MNIYSRAIWVDEGDIVAYSGESGVGFPHLHFELRRNIFTPINPLSCKEIIKKVKDTKAPVIRGLTVFPLYNTARVNSHFFPIRYEVDNLSGNICKVNKTIYLNSNDLTQYLISIDLHDKSDKSSSKLGIYSIQIKINGKKIYNDRINDIDYRSNKKGWLYFNQYLSSTYAGRYYFNLLPDYRQLGNLPTFKKMFPTSPVNLKTGLNILTAEYKDYHGNKVVLKADIFCSSFVFNKNYSGLDLNRTIDYFNDGRFSTLSNTKNKFKYSQKHKKISSIEKSNYFTLDFSKTFTTGEIFEDLKPGKRLRKLVFIKNGDALKVGNCEFKNNCGEDILLIKKSTSGKIFKNKSIKFHTPVWEIFPKNLRFAKNKNLGITFFHTDYTKEMLKKIGLFSINKNSNSLSLAGHGISKKSMNIQSLKSFSGKYTFASDLSDPKITKVFRNNQKRLVAKFKDIGKGINWLSIDVQNKKDGKSIPGIPDPDRGQWVSIKKIPKNINVVITVKDRADNICV